ncbi:hypothetical protein HJC23_002439 [Cyclotella cryptica]
MKKEHHARRTGHHYHGAGRDLVVEIEGEVDSESEIQENEVIEATVNN